MFWKKRKPVDAESSADSSSIPTLKEYFELPDLRFILLSESTMIFKVYADKQPVITINYPGGNKEVSYHESVDYSGNGTLRELLMNNKTIDFSLETTATNGLIALSDSEKDLYARTVFPYRKIMIRYDDDLRIVT